MSASRIVIDTNVVVAGLRSRRGASFRLLSRVGLGRFDICLSVPLLLEYEDVLGRETLGISSSAADDVLNYLCRVAIAQPIYYLWRPFLRDPKDDLVLELAVASQSRFIVTYNLKDFAGCERFDLRPMRPASFMQTLRDDL